jgi:prephenate dehydrogenase
VIRRLAVIGVGLLGGSVAKGARAAGLARQIVGVGRDLDRLRPAVDDGTLDDITTALDAGVRDADFVVLAAPVVTNERLLETVWRGAADEAVVTDVGSTKASLARVAARLSESRPLAFVGSHPMAGSDRSGYAVARADLLQGATVVVTPTDATDPRAVKTVTAFWDALGARVATLDPDTHDRVVAAISHLPHLVAFALVDAVRAHEPAAFDFAARGFKDTTRIAASDPTVWQEIFLANRDALAASLAAFSRSIDALVAGIAAGDAATLEAALARIKRAREALR